MIDQLESAKIIDAIKKGDNSIAIKKLFHQVYPIFANYVKRNNGTEADAQDIFQDSLLALIKTIRNDKFIEGNKVESFLLHVSKNLWINHITKKDNALNRQDVTTMENRFSHNDTNNSMLKTERAVEVNKILELVGERCKELLLLANYENVSMKLIAIQLGLSSEDVAKSTHYRCKQKMIALVKERPEIYELFTNAS